MRRDIAAAVFFLSLASPVLAWQSDPGAYRATGRVVMQDGSPIPDAVMVEFICHAQVQKRVKPFANGDFVLVLGNDSSDLPDLTMPRSATAAGALPFSTKGQNLGGEDVGRFDFSGCEVQALLAGFQSNRIVLGPRRRLDKSEIGQLVLRSTSGVDAVMVSANMLAAPSSSRLAFDNARREIQNEKPDYALVAVELKKALDGCPTFAAAWHLLGITRLAQKNTAEAVAAFRKAIEADANYIEPYVELASIELVQQRWADAARWIDPALKLNPNIPYANYLAASVHFQLGNLDQAERAALALWNTPEVARYPLTHYILGAVKAQRGDFESAAARFRDFLATKPAVETAQSVNELLSEWEREGRITK